MGRRARSGGKQSFLTGTLEGGRGQPACPHRWPPIMTPCHPTRLERLRVSQVSVKGTGAGVRMDKARPVHKGLQTKPRGNEDSGTGRTQEDTLEGVGREYLGWRGPSSLLCRVLYFGEHSLCRHHPFSPLMNDLQFRIT